MLQKNLIDSTPAPPSDVIILPMNLDVRGQLPSLVEHLSADVARKNSRFRYRWSTRFPIRNREPLNESSILVLVVVDRDGLRDSIGQV